ncbi:hypothetical protein LZ32DRAFT_599179 [Colletotrichum eremochloae]|nr:hypothetical protein LZ32DRAFT_599179 [Colletotrichum eremochloae]
MRPRLGLSVYEASKGCLFDYHHQMFVRKKSILRLRLEDSRRRSKLLLSSFLFFIINRPKRTSKRFRNGKTVTSRNWSSIYLEVGRGRMMNETPTSFFFPNQSVRSALTAAEIITDGILARLFTVYLVIAHVL